MNNFVMTRLMGGLGNQMFQYAAGKSIAIKHNVPLLVDSTFLEKNPKNGNYTKRNLELNVWKTEIVIAENALVHSIRKFIDNRAYRVLSNFRIVQNEVLIVSEKNSLDSDQIQKFEPPCYLDGYWQDENYFADIKSLLQKEFTPRESISEINKNLLDIIHATSSASIHVRRGDYITLKDAANFHGVCSLEYYQKAIELLFDQNGVEHFFVFSDDLEWTKTNLKFPCDVTFVDHNAGVQSYWDIHLMSNCKHHIIANSSFSWWGAWLNPSIEKKVIAPNNWFAAGGGENIVPKNWIKL